MNPQELIAKYEAQLSSANPVLHREGLPSYYQGLGQVNPDYALENMPRIVWRWWPMGFNLDQLYLVHKPSGRIVNIHGIANGQPFAV